MKRLLSLLLTLCMILSLLTVGAFAAENRDALADGYYLIGTHNSWDPASLTEALRFHESLGDSDEFVLETTLTQGQAFKVVRVENGAVAQWYPDGTGNDYVVDADHAGPAIIYFRSSYHSDWAGNGGYVWVGGKPAVEYLDENGQPQTCAEYTTANFAGETWTGWIVVNENTSLGGVEYDPVLNDFVGPRIQVSGDVCLILEDGKTLTALSGVHVPSGSSLTIYGQQGGTGALIAGEADNPMYSSSAGLGGDGNEYGDGELVVNGGIIHAIGGDMGAGIGGGLDGSFGLITVNGGEIHATGAGDCGDGIGTGDSANECPDILINGGEITAQGGGSGAGIGCYHDATLTINGGTITAVGGVSDGGVGGAGIGGNYVNQDAGTIVINGGTVSAVGGDGRNPNSGGAGIGGASGGNGGSVTVNGGSVTAVGGAQGGAGIGPGARTYLFPMEPGEISTIEINGGQITASAANAAGIGFYGTQNYNSDPVVALVDLGWTEESDFIQSTSYAGSVSLADDWNVVGSDETFAAGPVDTVTALANKKLIPPAPVILEPIETSDLRIYSSISVGTDMVVTWTARKTDVANYEKFWIEVVKHAPDGDETYLYGAEQAEALNEGSTSWSCDFKHIFAKEMGVEIEARVYAEDANGQIFMSPAKSTSIRDYLGGRLTLTNNTLEQRVLAADMLNYGTAAQLFTNYDVEHLVNEELTADQLAKLDEYETKDLPPVEKTNSNYRPDGQSNILFNSVSLDNEVILSLTVRAAEGSEVKVLMKDHETGTVLETLDAAWNGSNYVVDYSGIGADKMRVAYDFTAQIDGEETGNIRTWSVEGYVGELRSGNNQLRTNVANALLTYGDSAAAYFAAK